MSISATINPYHALVEIFFYKPLNADGEVCVPNNLSLSCNLKK